MEDIKELIKKIHTKNFTSNTHTIQTRLFGYITTNIRSPQTLAVYISQLVPEYIKRKKKPLDWKNWCYDIAQQKKDKHKFKRLELAALLFRNTEKNANLNLLAEKLYEIIKSSGIKYVTAFLYLYLLSGRYFGIEKQPLTAIDKIINSFKGSLIEEAQDLILNNNYNNRLFIAAVLYNPSCEISYDFAFKILSSKNQDLTNLYTQLDTAGSPLKQKITNAGGIKNFTSDVFTIVNYYLFKKACENIEEENLKTRKEKIISKYIDLLFDAKLNNFLGIADNEKDLLTQTFQRLQNHITEIILYACGIKGDDDKKIFFEKNAENKSALGQKQKIINEYEKKCFFDYCRQQTDWHKESYFLTKNQSVYLEIHHIIRKEYTHLFNNDIDIKENMIPLCPNCHRKLHNAQEHIVKELLKKIYSMIDKKMWMRKGIFVDINTLGSFYGLEEDLEKSK